MTKIFPLRIDVLYLGDNIRICEKIRKLSENSPANNFYVLPYYSDYKDYMKFLEMHSAVLYGDGGGMIGVDDLKDQVGKEIFSKVFLSEINLGYEKDSQKRADVGIDIVSYWNKISKHSKGYLVIGEEYDKISILDSICKYREIETIKESELESKIQVLLSRVRELKGR